MKKIALVLAFLLVLLTFAACSEPEYTEDEIRVALESLIAASEELNEIYFGEGLPLSVDEDELIAYYESLDSDIRTVGYEPVSEECKYQTESELREATLAVFTEDYSAFLFERAFSGMSVMYDDETAASTIYAMYIETGGVLTKRVGVKNEALPLGREYDIDKLTVVNQKNDYVLVDVPTSVDGQASVTVRLKLVMTDGGWRLDSPTY